MRISFFAAAASVLLAACASVPPAAAPSPKAFVIRHFEKEAGDDPALTPVGQANAVRLAERLAGEHIVAIYSTDTRRTRDSAAPSGMKFALMTEIYEPKDYAALSEKVAAQPGNVLVIGHSNTVPGIVEQISGTPQPPIDESRYGDLFVIDRSTKAVVIEHIGP